MSFSVPAFVTRWVSLARAHTPVWPQWEAITEQEEAFLLSTYPGKGCLFPSSLSPQGTRVVRSSGHWLEVRKACVVLGEELTALSLSFPTCQVGVLDTCAMLS